MRLVDADELLEHTYRDKLDSRELIANMIKNAPTVKAEHTAEWKIVGKTTFHYECSICGEAGDKWDKFCKHCGRKMTNAVAE